MTRILRLLAHQVAYEQRVYWRNRTAAILTLGFPVLLVGVTGAFVPRADHAATGAGNAVLASLVSFTVMSTAFQNVAHTLVARRQLGQLKRLRGTPVPSVVIILGLVGSIGLIAVLQATMLVALAPVLGAAGPRHIVLTASLVALGTVAFGALAVAATAKVSRPEVSGPVVSIGFLALLFLSGAMVPLPERSVLARASSWFPMRPLRTALEQAMGLGAVDLRSVAIVAAWGLVAVPVAARRFRWIANG